MAHSLELLSAGHGSARRPEEWPTVILAAGHESGWGRDLLPQALACGAFAAVPPGLGLHQAVTEAVERTQGPVCVVPMTLGRDDALRAQSLRTLQRLPFSVLLARRVVLTQPLGLEGQLTGWLRAAWRHMRSGRPAEHGALLITAAPAGGEADVSLLRSPEALRRDTEAQSVSVVLERGRTDLSRALARRRGRGTEYTVVLGARFAAPRHVAAPDVLTSGALLTGAQLVSLVLARCRVALHSLAARGDDGITADLTGIGEHVRSAAANRRLLRHGWATARNIASP